jgi:hypothetical protein
MAIDLGTQSRANVPEASPELRTYPPAFQYQALKQIENDNG